MKEKIKSSMTVIVAIVALIWLAYFLVGKAGDFVVKMHGG